MELFGDVYVSIFGGTFCESFFVGWWVGDNFDIELESIFCEDIWVVIKVATMFYDGYGATSEFATPEGVVFDVSSVAVVDRESEEMMECGFFFELFEVVVHLKLVEGFFDIVRETGFDG